MKLLLQLVFLGLLCFHVSGWVLKRDPQRETPKESYRELSLEKNRELFLSALHEYLSAKGIQVNKTTPAFLLNDRDSDTRTHGMQEEQEVLDSKVSTK